MINVPSDQFQAVDYIPGDQGKGLIFLCDHADRLLPDKYGKLGLYEAEFDRHIAYDIGAAAVTRYLCKHFNAPGIMTCFSRLLIDPNRGEDDPTLIMRISDGAAIEGNRHVDEQERNLRLNLYHRPYHNKIASILDEMMENGVIPIIVSIHSFTADWRGNKRPWHVGILWDKDPRLAVPMIESFATDSEICVGDNEPYSGALAGDTMYRHGTSRGLAHALIEYRQDLIGTEKGAHDWAERTCKVLEDIIHADKLKQIEFFGSHTDK